MSSWTGSEDGFYASSESLEAQQALGTALYQEAAQSIPSIESVGDSDSDDEDEAIIFSGLHNSHQEEPLTQEGLHPSSRQTPAKPLYSWQPSSPGAEKQISTSWSSLSQGHQAQSTPKPQNQHLTGPHLCELAQTASTTHTNASQEDDRKPSTAGWFSGAAGQLAASRDSANAVDELAGHPSWQDRHSGTETEEEVERAFQQSVQGVNNPEPTNSSVQLTAAVHDMDIDHLLQKLICGEIEYNPHDPNSGLPPASSLFTDSEASSEAEEDGAALHSPAQSQISVLSNKVAAGVSANRKPLQQHDGAEPKQSQLMGTPSASNQGLHQHRASITRQKQANSQTRTANGTYIRHRQTSRLANRFQQHQQYGAEDSVVEEFEDWRACRAQLKQKSQQ